MPSQPVHSMPQASSSRHASFTSGPLRVDLTLSPQGRVVSKRETVAGRNQEWAYAYDDRGRLAVMETPRGGTHLVYGDNGGLEAAHLANGLVLEYVTDGLGRPVEKSIGGRVVERFHWLDDMRLGAWEDLAGGRVVKFVYGQGRVPRAARLEHNGGAVELVLGADQVGTVKAIATADGHLIQHITYDSFGNVLDLQGEDLGLPIGFAGGVRDRHLGLVRFGHRDFDPAIGRFTTPDPLGAPAVGESSSLTDGDSRDDTGGDHDPWEYCVDDPVNAVDPEGLQEHSATSKDSSSTGFWDGVKDFLTPPLLAPKGSPKREWAEDMIRRPLQEFADGVVNKIPTIEVEIAKGVGEIYKKYNQQ